MEQQRLTLVGVSLVIFPSIEFSDDRDHGHDRRGDCDASPSTLFARLCSTGGSRDADHDGFPPSIGCNTRPRYCPSDECRDSTDRQPGNNVVGMRL